jgi:hypothetical protein
MYYGGIASAKRKYVAFTFENRPPVEENKSRWKTICMNAFTSSYFVLTTPQTDS